LIIIFNDIFNHVGTTPAWAQTPHVFPVANLINPLYPQLVPQEFLIFHVPSAATPTNKTAWLIFVPQLDKTPPRYELQLEASTVTEIGSELIPDDKPEHPEKLLCPEILKFPPAVLQVWSLPT